MRNYNLKTTFLAITLSFFGVTSAYSQQAITDACIKHKINNTNSGYTLCQSYILGFLNGALLTDTAIIDNFINEKSSFFQRAYKTRAVRTKKPLPATYLANFCLPEPVPQGIVVETIIENLDQAALKSKSLNQVVYETIKNTYPCEK